MNRLWNVGDLGLFLPPAILIFGAALLLVLAPRLSRRRLFITVSACLTVVIAGAVLLCPEISTAAALELLAADPLGKSAALLLLVLLLFTLLVAKGPTRSSGSCSGRTVPFLLLSGAGGLVASSAGHLAALLLGVTSLVFPLLALNASHGEANHNPFPTHRYFAHGIVGLAWLMLGAAMLWGGAGNLGVAAMQQQLLAGDLPNQALAMWGTAFLLGGIAYYVGLVPFHLWLPELYRETPLGMLGWFSGALPVALFVFLVRWLGTGLPEYSSSWPVVMASIAAVSMIWGNLAALRERHLVRMLAYANVAHAGYLAVVLTVAGSRFGEEIFRSLVFYLSAYAVANLAVFCVLAAVAPNQNEEGPQIRGMAKEHPVAAAILFLSLLSLAGFPPLAGFFARFQILALALKGGHYLLVAVGVATSLLSLAYYLKVAFSLYMREPKMTVLVRVDAWAWVVLAGSAFVTMVLSVFPEQVIGFFLGISEGLVK